MEWVLYAFISSAIVSPCYALYKGIRGMRLFVYSIVSITISMLCTLVAINVTDKFTIYECVFISAGVSVIVVGFFVPLFSKRKLSSDYLLEVTCFCSILVASYSILTYGQTVINSDIASANILCRSIIENGCLFPSSWYYANAGILFPDNYLFTLIPSIMFNDQSLARMIGSLVNVLIAVASIILVSKKCFWNNSWVISVPLFLMFINGGGTQRHVLYEASYTSCMLWSMLIVYFIGRIYVRKDISVFNTIASCLLVACLSVAGERSLAEYSLPAFGACCILLWIDYRKNQVIGFNQLFKKLGFYILIIIVPSLLGFCIYKWLGTWHYMNYTVNNQIVFASCLEEVWDNIIKTILNLFSCFGYSGNVPLLSFRGILNCILVAICAMVCFIVPILQVKKIHSETGFVRFFIIYVIIHNMIMLIMSTAFSHTQPRYLLSSVFLFVVMSARYMYVYWIKTQRRQGLILSAMLAVATCIACVGLLSLSRGWATIKNKNNEFVQEMKSNGIEKAYATFWNAYTNELYSDFDIRFGAVNFEGEKIVPFRWLVDESAYDEEESVKSAVILSNQERETMENSIIKNIGKPIKVYQKTEYYQGVENNMNIYVFDYDVAREMAGKK